MRTWYTYTHFAIIWYINKFPIEGLNLFLFFKTRLVFDSERQTIEVFCFSNQQKALYIFQLFFLYFSNQINALLWNFVFR